MKKLFGFNLDVELKERLKIAAGKKYTSSSSLLNQVLKEWLDKFEGVKEVEKVAPVVRKKRTEEDRLKDWEWRKEQVAKGNFPEHMGEEYPIAEVPGRKDVYLTADGKARDGRSDEEIEFDKSTADSIGEAFNKNI